MYNPYQDNPEVADALRLAQRRTAPLRLHQSLARTGYDDGGSVAPQSQPYMAMGAGALGQNFDPSGIIAPSRSSMGADMQQSQTNYKAGDTPPIPQGNPFGTPYAGTYYTNQAPPPPSPEMLQLLRQRKPKMNFMGMGAGAVQPQMGSPPSGSQQPNMNFMLGAGAGQPAMGGQDIPPPGSFAVDQGGPWGPGGQPDLSGGRDYAQQYSSSDIPQVLKDLMSGKIAPPSGGGGNGQFNPFQQYNGPPSQLTVPPQGSPSSQNNPSDGGFGQLLSMMDPQTRASMFPQYQQPSGYQPAPAVPGSGPAFKTDTQQP